MVVRILLLVGFEFAVCPNLRLLVLGCGSVRGREGFDHLIGGGRGASESQSHFHRVSNTHKRLRAFRALAWAVSPLSCGIVQQGVGPGGSAGAEPVVRYCPATGPNVGKTEEVVNLRTTMGDNHVGVAWTRHTALVICKPMARVYGLDAALPHMNV